VNGITGYFLTNLDVLSGIDRVPVSVVYEVDRKRYEETSVTQAEFYHAVAVYEYFDGWSEDISKARTLRLCLICLVLIVTSASAAAVARAPAELIRAGSRRCHSSRRKTTRWRLLPEALRDGELR
jgi:adenylosuccinate synthase